jgi:hypothetical protein
MRDVDKEMKAFTGQTILHIEDQQVHVSISLNPKAGVFEAELLASVLPDELFRNSTGPAKTVRLTDISIPLPTGTLQCAELEDVFLGGEGGVSMNITETPISRALNLADDRSGIRRLTLSPKAALIHFHHTPPLESLSELYFLNNFISGIPATISVSGADVHFLPRKTSLSVTGPCDLRQILPRIKAAWSVLQGAYLSHAASYNDDGGVDLAVRRPRPYYKGNSLFRGWENLNSLLDALIQAFVGKSEDDFKGWEKAISFYLEGRNPELDYDVRIIGFMIFIEMFDGSSTMSKQSICQKFNCSIEFAEFLVRMRNKLIHERMTIWNAVPQVHADILHHQAGWSCPEIDFSIGEYETASILFFLHIERLVNEFIVTHIRYSGAYANNAEIIADLNTKLVEQGGGGQPATRPESI